ncbi:hypothetical protein [Actinacidiphila oryziradicis]|uniref:hypothetical protein n=1 Tax=Actinacidiphila oryziradicis TaxID=2571141 RepID=UPI001FE35AC4|nr:hypothetical protein [Actinacidiphila oryziradicis]
MAAQSGRQVSGQGGEHRTLRPRQARPRAELPAQHRDLMAQREQLGLLDRLRTRQQQKQPEESVEDQVEHAQRHAIRACHDQPETQNT